MSEGISGSGLVSVVVEEWEQVVKKVARAEVYRREGSSVRL